MASNEIALMDEDALKEMVYEIRGQKAMLDFDLARIYGYQTKRFNEQIQRNIERFPEEFRFRTTRFEINDLVRSQKSTSPIASMFSGQSGGSRYLPYAYTEQGITRQRRIL